MFEIRDHDTVIFLGDSVTDCGRHHPRGEGPVGSGAYGGGYAYFFTAFYKALHPEKTVRFINKGTGGNQTIHVLERLDQDVIDYKPDIVTLCIGINDVWRLFDEPQVGSGIVIEQYEQNMREIITRIKAVTDKLLIITPYIIDTNRDEPMRAMMDDYGAVCKKLAAEYDLPVFDLQAMFDQLIKDGAYTYELSGDRIHPSPIGHAAITTQLLRFFGEQIGE